MAAALVASAMVPGLEVLSLDERIRRVAVPLGLRVHPS